MFDIIQNRTNVLNIYSEAVMRSYININKKQMFIAVSAFILILSVMSVSSVIRSHAMSSSEVSEQEVYYKYTAMYRVCAGDTLSSIAHMYMDDVHYHSESEYISELRKMNQMYFGDDLTSGELITVCYYSTEYR
jgi:hypothetical protein